MSELTMLLARNGKYAVAIYNFKDMKLVPTGEVIEPKDFMPFCGTEETLVGSYGERSRKGKSQQELAAEAWAEIIGSLTVKKRKEGWDCAVVREEKNESSNFLGHIVFLRVQGMIKVG